MQADYTMLDVESKDVVHAVRSKLTPALREFFFQITL